MPLEFRVYSLSSLAEKRRTFLKLIIPERISLLFYQNVLQKIPEICYLGKVRIYSFTYPNIESNIY